MSNRDLTSINSLANAASYMHTNDKNKINSLVEQMIAEAKANKREKIKAQTIANAKAAIKTISDRIAKQEKKIETRRMNKLIKNLLEEEKTTLRKVKMAEAEINSQKEGINRIDDIIINAYKFNLNISNIQNATAETMKRLANILPPNQLEYAREKLNRLEQEHIMALRSKFQESWKNHIIAQRNTEAREDAKAEVAAAAAAMGIKDKSRRTMHSGGKKKLYKTHKAKKLKKTKKNKKRKNKTKKFY